MGFAEKRVGYWRARYKVAPGQYGTVSDESGMRIKFRSRREAEAAAADAEAKVRGTGGRNVLDRRLTFGEFASQWYGEQDLATSTMQNYRRHIEEHLLPTFHPLRLAEIADTHVGAWERNERALGYAESSIKTWRGTLHLILGDAVEQGLIGSNPATRRRGRGKRAGRSRVRGPEKPITSPMGLLLLAERAALLAGRDDEFVAMMLMGYTGIRWAELVGLEVGFATWLFQPAATGWYPRKAPHPAHPVPIVAEPWPGIPVRGRNAAGRAQACWLPVARGLTPHGLRHTHKTLMEMSGVAADASFDKISERLLPATSSFGVDHGLGS